MTVATTPALDEMLCFRIYRANRALMRAYTPLLAEVGLTYPQYLVMVLLWEDPDRPLPMRDLCSRLDLDSATLTPMLKRLESLNLVYRKRDTADERRIQVELTGSGRAMREKAASVPEQFVACLGVTATEAQTLMRLVDKLI